METEKNLHASIPNALLAKAEKAASAEHISVDEWLQNAMEQRLRTQQRQELYAYGEGRPASSASKKRTLSALSTNSAKRSGKASTLKTVASDKRHGRYQYLHFGV